MSKLTMLDVLRTIRFLDEVTDKDRQLLAQVAQLETYQPEDVVFREGQRPGLIFLVVDGTVGLEIRVPEHGARRVQTVGPGELLGWSPVLGQFTMTATARALTPIRLVLLNAVQLLALCHHHPEFGFNFMRRTAVALAQRLHATRLRLLDVYQHELPVAASVHEGAD